MDSSGLQSTPVMTDISRLGCGESPLESTGVHMEYRGDRQELMISMSTGDLVPSKAPCPCNLKTNESKHRQSLCNACNISYACMTQHVILQHAYNAFNGWNPLVKGLSALIKRYVTSTTTHHTPQSSNRIVRDCNSLFGLRSCQKHMTSHSSVQKTSICLWASS